MALVGGPLLGLSMINGFNGGWLWGAIFFALFVLVQGLNTVRLVDEEEHRQTGN